MGCGVGPRQATHGVGHDREAVGVAQDAAKQFGQMIVQTAGDFTLVHQAGGTRGHENVGILPLMIVGGMVSFKSDVLGIINI